jgi:3-oxoadipate enol-lactonase
VSDVAWVPGTLESDGEEIYYEVSGAGAETVVFCHGLGGNHAVWFQQVPVFARSFRVVTWSQRGFGLSSNRAGASGPHAAVADLAALLDHLDIDRAHVVGQSMGGWAVVGFALRSPERVRSLVVADSTGGIVNERVTEVLVGARRREVPPSTLGAHAAIGEPLAREDPTTAFLYQQIGVFRGDVTDADMIGKLFSTRYPLNQVAALEVPALCVVGSDDDLIPPDAVREVATILDAKVVEIPNAGHSPYFEQPDQWNGAVLEFITELRRVTARTDPSSWFGR